MYWRKKIQGWGPCGAARIALMVVSLAFSPRVCSQVLDCEIELTAMAGVLPGEPVVLKEYYGKQLQALDTVNADLSGTVVFQCPSPNHPGRYQLELPNDFRIEFLYSGTSVRLTIRDVESVDGITAQEGKDTQLLAEFERKMIELNAMSAAMVGELDKGLAPDVMEESRQRIFEQVNNEWNSWQKEMQNEHPNSLMSFYLGLMKTIEPREAPPTEENPEEWTANDFRLRFWDGVDFDNPALVRDPSLEMMLEYYLGINAKKDPELMIEEAIWMMNRASYNSQVWKYLAEYFMFGFIQGRGVCMDKVTVDVFDHLDRQSQLSWLSESKIAEFRAFVDTKRRVCCGEVMEDLTLTDSRGQWTSLSDLDTDLRLLIVWDSGCDHCLEAMGTLNQMASSLSAFDVGVYSLGYDLDNEEREQLLREVGWRYATHVSDEPWMQKPASRDSLIAAGLTTKGSLQFRDYLDVDVTPKLYLLDRENRILAKDFKVGRLFGLLKSYSH